MSRHDDTNARQLDELVDELQHGADVGRDDIAYLFAVPDALGDVAELLQADADRAGHVPADVARLRTRVLDGAAAHDRRHRRARLPRRARRFNRSLLQRVLVPTMAIMGCIVATTALGHTDTSVGSAVRTAARTLNLPAPAEPAPKRDTPKVEAERVPTVQGNPTTGEVDPKLIAPGGDTDVAGTPGDVDALDEPMGELPPRDVPLDGKLDPKLPPPDGGEQLPPKGGVPLPPKDGAPLPPQDGAPLPPKDGAPTRPQDPTLPPPDGQLPPRQPAPTDAPKPAPQP